MIIPSRTPGPPTPPSPGRNGTPSPSLTTPQKRLDPRNLDENQITNSPPLSPSQTQPPHRPYHPLTYLDTPILRAHLQRLERSPDSQADCYRSVIHAILTHSLPAAEHFAVYQREPRGDVAQTDANAGVAVMQLAARPGGDEGVGGSWDAAEERLGRYCGGTGNGSGRVYGVGCVGLGVKFFVADGGVLEGRSGVLDVRDDVEAVVAMFGEMKRCPLGFV
ncbi:hypothetical protein BU16DRAFT_543035 [Lophium mytilinum]|uniref:Uncharacterized protein n=1 Tax=Lophium mytilinum TaxID=390894 RepID=A0A6A6QFA7_9PEZI|nr:hypothetical protein BU16DRAFT_543035 [Lophium mytilinum]